LCKELYNNHFSFSKLESTHRISRRINKKDLGQSRYMRFPLCQVIYDTSRDGVGGWPVGAMPPSSFEKKINKYSLIFQSIWPLPIKIFGSTR